jgi:hypothetical protein
MHVAEGKPFRFHLAPREYVIAAEYDDPPGAQTWLSVAVPRATTLQRSIHTPCEQAPDRPFCAREGS